MKHKFKLKVIKQINSPYRMFANIGDIIEYDNGLATSKNYTMALPNFLNYSVGYTILDKLKIKLFHYKKI